MSEKMFLAHWKYPGENEEFSVHRTESGAITSLEEEIGHWMGADFTVEFMPGEYEDLINGKQICFPGEDLTDGFLWVGMRILEVQE